MKHPPFLEEPESLRFARQRPLSFRDLFLPLVGPLFTTGPWVSRGERGPLLLPNMAPSTFDLVESQILSALH